MEPLIEFFGKNNRGLSQEGAVLVKEDFGFSMYFDTTSTTDSGEKMLSWYKMEFKEDFINVLKKYCICIIKIILEFMDAQWAKVQKKTISNVCLGGLIITYLKD